MSPPFGFPHLQIYLTNTRENIYEGAVSSVIAGNYTFDVTVVHTPYAVNETLGARDTWPFMFTRNLVLINNAVGTDHSLTVKCILKLLIVAPRRIISLQHQTWTASSALSDERMEHGSESGNNDDDSVLTTYGRYVLLTYFLFLNLFLVFIIKNQRK